MPRSRKSSQEQATDTPPVRYYPRRVGRSTPVTLTPSQALHLATDPDRAARAERTAERRSYEAELAPRPGRLRRWLHSLRR